MMEKRLLEADPRSAEANLRMAEAMLAMGDVAAAGPFAERALHAAEAALRPRALCVAAEVELAREDDRAALARATEAVQLEPGGLRPLVCLGAARARVAEYPASLRALAAALEDAQSAQIGCGAAEVLRLRVLAHTLSA